MKLHKFEIRNYKSISYMSVDWDDILIIIGENNCGKSSVLSALSYFLGGSTIKSTSVFRRHAADAENAIELIGHFDELTESESQQIAVRGRMYGDKWIIKKRYWMEPSTDEDEKVSWKEQLFSFSTTDQFEGWPDNDSSWGAFPDSYRQFIEKIPDRSARTSVQSRESLREIIRTEQPELIHQTEPSWVPNPGGGGNWKSNANSIMPRAIFIRAVHEATDETNAKDASTYGKLVNLVVERQLSQRPEMIALRDAFDTVLKLFRPDNDNPAQQAIEIRELQRRINANLSEIIAGEAAIQTEPPELQALLLPTTSLVIRDRLAGIETEVGHQGHGLQRTLIMTLLQLLAEVQDAPAVEGENRATRSTILLIEEPELYLHPQMERLMRDVLYRLASQPGTQIACCTHSAIFLDIAEKHKAIVRLFKDATGNSAAWQVKSDLFDTGGGQQDEKRKLQTVARFSPTVNELFFAKFVVLFEEFSAIAAFERAALLTGVFQRHKRLRRELALVDCVGKGNIVPFQRVLNAFAIPYRILHDADQGNPAEEAHNARISAALPQGIDPAQAIHIVQPRDLESLLGYVASKSGAKPFVAVQKVDELHAGPGLPAGFTQALNMVYFGTTREPPPPLEA